MKQTIAGLLMIVAWAMPLAAGAQGVPPARDLRRDAEAARKVNGPVLLVFVGEHCRYCETVLNEFLIPMSRNPDYQNKVVMRRIENSSGRALRDFAGKATSHERFADQQNIQLVPTVVLFDGQGKVLAKPLVGITTVDYYGMYLDEVIDQAVAKVRTSNTASPADIPK